MKPQRELEEQQMKISDDVDLGDDSIGTSGRAVALKSRRLNGKWRYSPLREAGTLLGVLKQEGLTGKGLVSAFERWLPRILGLSRADVNRLYREQTGREMPDEILIQKADKIVRYKQLPREAEVFRQIIAKGRESCKVHESTSRVMAPQKCAKCGQGTAMYKVRVEIKSAVGSRDATVIVVAREQGTATKRARSQAAELLGVPTNAVAAKAITACALKDFLVIDGYVMEQSWSEASKPDGHSSRD